MSGPEDIQCFRACFLEAKYRWCWLSDSARCGLVDSVYPARISVRCLPVSEGRCREPLHRISRVRVWSHCRIVRLIVLVWLVIGRPVTMIVPRIVIVWVGQSYTCCCTDRGPSQASYRCAGKSAESQSTESAESCTAKGAQDCKSHPNHMCNFVGRRF